MTRPPAPTELRPWWQGPTPHVRSDEVFVNEFGVAADGTNQSNNFKRALDAAVSLGKTLVVPPGTYNIAAVNVPGGTRLRGLTGATLQLPSSATQTRMLVLNGDDIVIEGLTIDGADVATTNDGLIFASALGLSDLTVKNCVIKGAARHAIRLANTAGNVQIVGNIIDGFDSSTGGGCGVSMISNTAGAPEVIRNVDISGNTIIRHTDGDGHGIAIRGANDHTRDIEHARIINNFVDLTNDDTKGCIECWALYSTIAGNTCWGGNMGISNGRSHVSIVGNTINGTAGNGIEASAGQAENITCTGNTIEDCVIGISAWGSGIECAIVGNTIKNVTTTGINANSPDSITVGNRVQCASGATIGIDTNLTSAQSDNQIIANNYVQMDDTTSSTIGIRITNTAEFTCNGNFILDADTAISLTGNLTSKNGTIVGNNFVNCTNKIAQAGTAGTLVRWANRGDIPNLTGDYSDGTVLASLVQLLEDAGVITDSTTA